MKVGIQAPSNAAISAPAYKDIKYGMLTVATNPRLLSLPRRLIYMPIILTLLPPFGIRCLPKVGLAQLVANWHEVVFIRSLQTLSTVAGFCGAGRNMRGSTSP